MIASIAFLGAALILLAYILAPRTRRKRRLLATRRPWMPLPIAVVMVAILLVAGGGVVTSALLPAAEPAISSTVAVAIAAISVAGYLIVNERAFVLAERAENSAARRVLIVGAHPDDLELACGGTVAAMVARGDRVKAAIMSNGHRGGDPEARRLEARVGAAALGVQDVEVFDQPDTEMATHGNDLIATIERVITEFSPDLILTHSENDYHQDHHAVHFAVVRAARQRSSILCFESPSVTSRFRPTVFVDIRDHLDTKIHAVHQHRDQRDKPYVTPEHIRAVAAFRGQQVRIAFAEGFEPVRLLEPPR